MSHLESLYKKKPTKNNSISKQESKNTTTSHKNYSIKIELTHENMLNITSINTKRNITNNSIDKLLNLLTTSKNNSSSQMQPNFLQKHVSVLVDGKKIEADRMIISKNNSMSILLDESSKYEIEAIVDK